jgi:predicted TPR repeat methyltransferase
MASLGGSEVPGRASNGYVRETFDRFAADFDATLTRLDYRAPMLVAAAVEFACGQPGGTLDVLDLGCGTGLCAPLLRPFARRLEGVDLSSAMLERARRRGGYDALHEAELGAFLSDYLSSWDVIVAADTLCYFGALEDSLLRAARALRPGGVLVFTVERLGTGQRYALGTHGRYAHSEEYLRAALAAANFEMIVARGALRSEGGQPVDGMVATGRTRTD